MGCLEGNCSSLGSCYSHSTRRESLVPFAYVDHPLDRTDKDFDGRFRTGKAVIMR